jgi:hypothetical protein
LQSNKNKKFCLTGVDQNSLFSFEVHKRHKYKEKEDLSPLAFFGGGSWPALALFASLSTSTNSLTRGGPDLVPCSVDLTLLIELPAYPIHETFSHSSHSSSSSSLVGRALKDRLSRR